MKFKPFTTIILTLILSLGYSNFHTQSSEKDYTLAKVGKKVYGVYIFLRSEPSNEYDFIATVDVNVAWNKPTRAAYEKVIKKAMRKYPNFNGMIFHNSNYNKADLIRFKGLEVTRGGVAIGSKVSFIQVDKVGYGTVVELESTKGAASVKYFDKYEEEKVIRLKYTELTIISEEEYQEKKEEFKKELNKYNFNIGQKVLWTENKESSFGEIVSLDSKYHKASIKYLNKFGEEKITKVSYLNLNKLAEEDFTSKLKEHKQGIENHTFVIGETVTWIRAETLGQNLKHFTGVIMELNDNNHKATIKYLDQNNVEKLTKISYLDLTKVKE
jgi:hypothetical protein